MSKVIVFASGKGGTGKSSVCVGLSLALAKRNNKVLLVDCDCGMRGLDLLLGMEDKLVFDASDIVKGSCNYSAAVYPHDRISGISLLPAPLEAENEISAGVMKQMIDELKGSFDYVLVDAPAGVGAAFEAAAAAADCALVVINAEPSSLRGCANILKKLRRSITDENIRLIINKLYPDDFFALGIYKDLDEVVDTAQIQLIGVVPEDYKFAAELQKGCRTKINTKVTACFDCIAARLQGENVPLAIDF